ncbi:Thi72p [Saccharomyces cerevisiae YJM1573]|uniref:Thiamine transporter n=2 Tax=Saccharomyces TaxID=4930 RepID=A0A6C1E1W7_SACPS|nr:Thi72p [Saccharomyces cerevisiae YJM320]AJT76007.1 Thi72p [Saccharomyces cerevisiae YJM450]AJT81917.1 Thi72p [Saccharomyces cerevisiae YJM689]AJT88774.1 Thi72p [Saccharomyces cerevisiae YJM1190]AJT93103.1 Thi72p [Saccharomyces cerevisiae YJM1273]AJT94072.1 Thi72p [Saccharomyces cerevisiae YJM1307]AJT96510.1 Thi72p [Saccharomyces cerevisiae YJM1338]AJU02884.1 Thi72p [Saccharomyces cerevisiae YJM1400]AJU03377.1 Thi72p [Saccharomyces cerevisiae YJM1401]AJU03876.1 Thi72p [Saccharomyces cere
MSFGTKISRALRFLEIPVKNRASVNFLRNPDLQPIKSVNQTWGFWSNFAYWGVLSFNVGMWIGGSSALTVGLSYSETIGAFIIADLLTILFALANSCPGYDWKVGFTLAQRFVFGIYGSALGIIIRILMSIVYYGSNAWLGGLCVNMILDSWSHHYLHLPNTLSSKVAMTTKELIGFIIFHILTAFCYFMKPYHMNYILIWSCVGTFFAMLGMVIYLTKSAHGVGDLFTSTHSTVTGSKKAWAWVYTISYWYGSVSPGCTNQSDFSRFGSSNCAIWTGTIVALLIPATLIPVFGIIGASACEKLYGQTFWMPMDIFDNWLTTNYSAGARAATFFCGFCFVMSQISYTISNCGFASGMDLAGLLPKYVDIKRGAIFAACVSWACLPWNFYNSSSTFLTVMSSFGVVMTPIITVMICDNFLIRKRQYSVTNAFVLKGEYYFTKGVNWRAIVAWVCGMAPGLPGIAWEVNNDYFHNTGIINFFYGDSFFSFLISFFVYWGLCLLFPFKITVKHDDKDYYGAFTDEEARKKGMVPYSEISEEEIRAYTLGECFTSGHEYKPESSDDELPELTKTSSENTKVFEIVHQKDNEKESSTSSEKQIA